LLTMFEALPASKIFASSIIRPSSAPVSDALRPMCVSYFGLFFCVSMHHLLHGGQHMVPSALVEDIISFLVGSGGMSPQNVRCYCHQDQKTR
jgi:hypothetical protein